MKVSDPLSAWLGIKNIGSAACLQLLAERQEKGPFADYYDFVTRMLTRRLNRKMIEALIDAGTWMSSTPTGRVCGCRWKKRSVTAIWCGLRSAGRADRFGIGIQTGDGHGQGRSD
ncbi:MAG: hypothetical protein ACLSA6_17005 [Holdemania massiliensis]